MTLAETAQQVLLSSMESNSALANLTTALVGGCTGLHVLCRHCGDVQYQKESKAVERG